MLQTPFDRMADGNMAEALDGRLVNDLVSVLLDGFVSGFDAVTGGVDNGVSSGEGAHDGDGGDIGGGDRVSQRSVAEVVAWIISGSRITQGRVERLSGDDGHQSGEDHLQYANIVRRQLVSYGA